MLTMLQRLTFAVALLVVTCPAHTQPQVATKANASKPIVGSPMVEHIFFQYAIYYLPTAPATLSALVNEAMKKQPSLNIVSALPKKPVAMVVRHRIITDVQTTYVPPDLKSLSYFGRGVSREQAEKLQQSRQALLLEFAHPKSNMLAALRAANQLVAEVARQGGGLIWDEETREVFSAEEWRRRRIDSWKDGVPDISQHTVIHAYKKQEYVRAITLGMVKFGLPDVVIDEFSWSMNTSMGNLINLFAQAMAEGAIFSKAGEFDLRPDAIRDKSVRDKNVLTMKKNSESIARLSFKPGTWEEGDPRNGLIEITFDRYPGRDNLARQTKMVGGLWGFEDSVVSVKHDDQLRAASSKARTQLPALQKAFKAGLPPGEFIQVKAPFDTPDGGREWMWVEIIEWKDDRIKGMLKNEPKLIPALHGGQIVEVKERDVFDYIRRFTNGREEGNETGRVIERMNKGAGK